MDITVVFAEDVSDQSLLLRLTTEKNGFLFFRNDALNAVNFKCKAIIVFHRKTLQTPVPLLPSKFNTSRLVVFSDCSIEQTIVDTLTAGAHHYIDLRSPEPVLAARLEASLRCHSQRKSRNLDIEPYTFNHDNRTVYHEDRLVNLSPREFELAYYLFANRARVVSDSELMTSVWSLPTSLDTRRIDTSICRIKKKLSLNTDCSEWKIIREHRLGYQVKR